MANESDPFTQFKAVQKEAWGLFAPLEVMTTPPAALLVEFANVKAGDEVLDIATGTGVVAVAAAANGARVSALDFSPALLERARWNASTAGVAVDFKEGDAEALPFADSTFDVVLSQFGHMFAPRPPVVMAEMLRVLKPGGRIAFSTWPPEMFIGKMFSLVAQYLPPPEGVAPPPQWGDPAMVRERLGDRVVDLQFDRQILFKPSLSPRHSRLDYEATAGPMIKLKEILSKENPAKLEKFQREFEDLISTYRKQNQIVQHFLMTRAKKKAA